MTEMVSLVTTDTSEKNNLTDFEKVNVDHVIWYEAKADWDSHFLRINIKAYSGIQRYDLIFKAGAYPKVNDYDNKIHMTKNDDGSTEYNRTFVVVSPGALGFKSTVTIYIGLTPTAQGDSSCY